MVKMDHYELLTSRQNPKIREACALLTAAARRQTGLFLLEGARLCADAAQNGVQITDCFFTDAAFNKYGKEIASAAENAGRVYRITDAVAEKLSDTRTPQGVFCVCRQRPTEPEIRSDGFYLMTDNIQNPDNLGAIARTAEAFGAAGMIVSGGCDVFAPKALRASMGALLRFPVLRADDAVLTAAQLKKQGLRVYAAALHRASVDVTAVPKTGGSVMIVGNEGSGVSEALLEICDQTVYIPMRGRAESLNAAVAAAILIWEFTK